MASMAPSDSTTESTERHESDLYIRPGWVDADIALVQLDQGKAQGDRGILWVRGRIQKQLRVLGKILDAHAGKVLFVSILAIATFSVGLKSKTFHSDIELLWAEPSVTSETSSEMLPNYQMVLQTGSDSDVDLLNPHGLLEHLALVQKASQVTVTKFDITWTLKDFCQSPPYPNFDPHFMNQIFEKTIPCSIVTPLDCFWEGAKLHGPDHPVYIPGIGSQIKWTNLHPNGMISQFKQRTAQYDFSKVEDYFKRAGITTGYLEKPCLNPRDPDCPNTAPNKNHMHPPDIGAEITSGCYGFATKYMHWPEDLIVGGIQKNKTGHIKKAKALQTVVQLMNEHELYDLLSDNYKVHHISWSKDKATVVLNAWQKKFAEEVERLSKNSPSSSYVFFTFSTANANKLLMEYSRTDVVKLGIVLVVACLYGWVTHSAIAALGVLVLASSTAAALGVCSLIGLPMNLLSTHVLPFITVGLAMREMFLILSTSTRKLLPVEVLQRTGPSIISAAFINSGAFVAAAILPIPALRVFCLQCAIMIIFHGVALMVILPAFLSLQQRCREADVPCFRSESRPKVPNNNNNNKHTSNVNNPDVEHGSNLLNSEQICQKKKGGFVAWCVTRYLTTVLFRPFMKVLMCLTYAVLIIFCMFNGLKLEFDVRLSTFLPKNTQEYKYLEAHNKFFGFYNFYLVTTELEYPLNQPLLYEYHSSLTQVPHVLKDSNGGLNMNDFWLANFRDFLIDLQQEFDYNRNNNCLNSEKWFPNATEKAVLAFKLLSQTGVVQYPVDKSQILKKRLVRNNIIDPNAFYNYLSVWNSNDQISYSSSQGNLTPKPFEYESSKIDMDLRIPKSQPLVYTQMPFYLKNLKTTSSIIATLKQIKDISEQFNNRGLKNFPIGLIFSYFNQFLYFDRFLAAQFILTLISAAVVACVLVQWIKLWSALFSTVACLLLLCLININALSGTIGALHFIIITRNIFLILTGYLSSIGNRERRVKLSLEINSEPILKGDLGLLVCSAVLATSQFEFIHLHLCSLILLSVGGSLANSFIFFPLLLALVGPKAELQPIEHTDRISTPPPSVPSPVPTRNTFLKPPKRNTSNKATREPSLTTITEESCNQSIVVEPQVTVEYSSPESSSSGQFTTKVTATANIKVEVVAPVYRSGKCNTKCHRSFKSDRRKRQEQNQKQCRCCKDSTSSDSNTETEQCPSS